MKNNNKLRTLTALFGLASITIHAANKFISASAGMNTVLDEREHYSYNWRFGNIYYTKSGQGSPVLLIHDIMPGSSGYEWNKVVNELSKNHTVYVLDLLGCGRSEKPGITYTNFLYVQLICDFVKKVIGEPADIIASRFSSTFAVMSSAHDNALFKKIILINPPSVNAVNNLPSRRHKILKELLEIPVFGTLIYHMIVSKENTKELIIDKLFYNPFNVDEDLIDAYYTAAHNGGNFAKNLYACYLSKYLNVNLKNALKNISGDVLIITGQDNSNISAASTYTNLNETIDSVNILHTGKLPHIELPEAFINIAEDFL